MTGLILLLVVTLAIAAIVGVVALARWSDAVQWRKSLVGYQLRLPSGLKPEQVATWLSSLSALTHAPRGALVPSPPILLEVRGSKAGIEHRLYAPKSLTGAVLASIRAALPGVRLEVLNPPDTETPADGEHGKFVLAASLRQSGTTRQLATDRAEAVARALLAGMQPLGKHDRVCWQWIITGAGTPAPVRPAQQTARRGSDFLPWWLQVQSPPDADELRSARLKQAQPLLNVSGRLLVEAGSRSAMHAVFARVWGPVRMLNLPGTRLVRSAWPSAVTMRQFTARALPHLKWPLTINTAELAGLVAFPLGDALLPGLPVGSARQLPPTGDLPVGKPVTLADSNYPGSTAALGISRRDRTMHVWLGGPTGVGKSTLMANLALQDIANGDGLALIDPKGDLVDDILARIPENRQADVVIVNPADSELPVGVNILAHAGTSEAERELSVDHVLHVLRQQWSAFWGPRTDMVLRMALMALTNSSARNGDAFTLCEVPELLSNKQFRRFVMSQCTLPESVGASLRWFDGLSDNERTQVIGPAMNKLSTFTSRTPLRLMLGQSRGIDVGQLMRQRKILLVPLSRGQIGAETAGVVGSLVVANIWQAGLGRIDIPAEQRRPYWLHIDEAQEIVRLPVEVSDMLAEARGLGLGMTLANQHLTQLPESVRRAVLSTVRSQVVFQVEPDDARVLARSFGPHLTEQDLRSLPAYEVAMRLCAGGQTGRPVTGTTRPLSEATTDLNELRNQSRQRYGTRRADVEAALSERLTVPGRTSGDMEEPTDTPSFGSRRTTRPRDSSRSKGGSA